MSPAVGVGVRAALIGLALMPPARIAWLLARPGVDTPSNDDIFYLLGIVEPVLDGRYEWSGFLRDSFYVSHQTVLLALEYLVVARFANLSILAMLWARLLLYGVQVALLVNLLPRRVSGAGSWIWWLAWPTASLLIFSPSRLTLFEQANAGHFQHVQLAALLGAWGIARFAPGWRLVCVLLAGGAIASLSAGAGPLLWPLFIAAYGLVGGRAARHYIALAIPTGLTFALYFWQLVILANPAAQDSGPKTVANVSLLVQLLGLPLAEDVNNPATATALGLCLVAFVLSGAVLLWWRRGRVTLKALVAPGLLLVFGALTAYQLSVFRTFAAPWYVFAGGLVWQAAAVVAGILAGEAGGKVGAGHVRPLARGWAALLITVIVLATARLSVGDVLRYSLRTRSPAAASCLRLHVIAPTWCERTIFSWWAGLNTEALYSLGRFMERHRLAVFSRHQTWWLQGDYGLPLVRVIEREGIPRVMWTRGTTSAPARWNDTDRLDLFLHSPNVVEWTVSFPADSVRIDLVSGVKMDRVAPRGNGADGATPRVEVRRAGAAGSGELLYTRRIENDTREWQRFNVPLTHLAGQTVTLRFGSEPGGNLTHDWLLFERPRIEVERHVVNGAGPRDAPVAGVPSNTDGSPIFPELRAEDLRLAPIGSPQWEGHNMDRDASGADAWRVRDDPYLVFQGPLNVPLRDYTDFYVQLAVPQAIVPRALQIYFVLDRQAGFAEERSVVIPLLPDGELRGITYAIKLLEVGPDARLTGLRIDPIGGGRSGADLVRVADVRLLRRVLEGA